MIYCWFTQSIMAWNLDAGRPVSGGTQKHLARCPSCRHFYQSQTRLIRELTDVLPPKSSSPFLQARILRALEESEVSVPRHRRTAILSMTHVWATGLAVVVLVGTIAFLRLSSSRPGLDGPATASVSIPAATNLAVVNGQKLIALGNTLESPLKREMQYLVSDAKNAINSLAMTCLPAQTADAFGLP